MFPTRAMQDAIVSWRRVLEDSRVIKSAFNKLILSLRDGLTKECCIATHLFWKTSWRLGKRSGWLFLALYLKQCRVILQRYVAGDKPPTSLAPAVSLTRSGLPRIIPSFHRKKIREGDHSIVQLYLTLFSTSKIIELSKRVSKETLASVTDPSDPPVEFVGTIRRKMRVILHRYIPTITSVPLNQGLEFVPTWKSVPSSSWYRKLMARCGDSKGASLKPLSKSSLFPCFFSELAAFQFLMTFVHSRPDGFYSQGCLWPPYIRYPFDSTNRLITQWSLEWFERRIGPLLPSPDQLGIPPNTGKLCCACTGDGKRRLFAVGNYINQRLLYPVHAWLVSLLRRLRTDGTFDQLRPLRRLKDAPGGFHSVDLKAATDRWPLLLLFELIQACFDRNFASSVVNSTLGLNLFEVSFLKKRKSVSFITGQALGYYSSWPLFALSHHMMVWYAAERVYPGVIFDKYAILGDDIVIADDLVNEAYCDILTQIGVSKSESKSIDSASGACEFAKTFWVDRMRENLSPLSLKKVLRTNSPLGWYHYMGTLHSPLRLSTKLRIGGFGFKACSRPLRSRAHGFRARRYLVLLAYTWVSEYSLSIDVAIGLSLGFMIHPSVVGMLWHHLWSELAPKELQLPPSEVYPYPGMMDFNEYSLYRGWMKQYLNYLRWYYLLALTPGSLNDFLDAPVYTKTWHVSTVDLSTYRYGLLFRLYDLAVKLSAEPLKSLA